MESSAVSILKVSEFIQREVWTAKIRREQHFKVPDMFFKRKMSENLFKFKKRGLIQMILLVLSHKWTVFF